MQELLNERPEIQYEINNILSYRTTKQFDFIIDKGCVDCLLSDPEDPVGTMGKLLHNLKSLLKTGGMFFTITFDLERDELMEEVGEGAITERQDTIKVQLVPDGIREVFYLFRVVFK